MDKNLYEEIKEILLFINPETLEENTKKLIILDEFFSNSQGIYDKLFLSMEKMVSGESNTIIKLSKEEQYDLMFGLGFYVQFSLEDQTSRDDSGNKTSSFRVLIKFHKKLKDAFKNGIF
jgi:hypothetical protein